MATKPSSSSDDEDDNDPGFRDSVDSRRGFSRSASGLMDNALSWEYGTAVFVLDDKLLITWVLVAVGGRAFSFL